MSARPLLEALRAAVGEAHVLVDEADQAPFLVDWRGLFRGRAQAVVMPGSTDEVAAVVRACAERGVPIVPQGGNTGQVAGATPDASGRAVVLVLTRLNRVRHVDLENDTMTVEAGCVLQALQQAAEAQGRLFPLSLGAEGSCTIGGNLATNAGGTQVLRYGNVRELALGLEVVLADGEVLHGLRGLRKDNTGYDLRDLFIGSEGTLGIITAATLKLFPLPTARATALVALPSIALAGRFLARCRIGFDATLTGFELISRQCLELVTTHFPQQALPLRADAPWFVLLELTDDGARLEAVLEAAMDAGEATDAAIAQTLAQRRDFWRLRESITLALARDGKCLKHDVSLPVSAVPGFVADMDRLLQARWPGVRNYTFGHLGDGNLHYNVARPIGATDADLAAMQPGLSKAVHDAVASLGGSISAEQGIGRQRTGDLAAYKQPRALALMRGIKAVFDPQGLLNPGVILSDGL